LLCAAPLLATSCTVQVPLAVAVNVGWAVFASASEAPAGPEAIVHA
jgi:hypothetical protein